MPDTPSGPVLLLLLFALAGLGSPARANTCELPRMPSLRFAPEVAVGIAVGPEEIRHALSASIPAGPLQLDLPPPSAAAGRQPARAIASTPIPVALLTQPHPVIDISDVHYARLDHAFVPVLLDWFEAAVASQSCTMDQIRARGFGANKVARLMHVFASIRLHRDHGADPGMAPAIGWCRVLLREDFGHGKAGDTTTLVLVGTDRGWFALDPFTRTLRRFDREDRHWIVEFVVL